MSLVMNRTLTRDKSLPAANTAAALTFAAVAGQKHHLVYVAWSYSAAPTGGKLTVEDGVGTTVFEVDVTAGGPGSLALPPIIGSVNTALVVTLAAGGASVTGKLNCFKFTE